MGGRRTTLGPVSSSGMNARMSMGPAPRNIGGLQPGSKDDRRMSAVSTVGGAAGRLSMGLGKRESLGPGRRGSNPATAGTAGGGGNRVSRGSGVSTYGNRPGAKSDPRPVTDKTYMQDCIRNLIYFLTEHGFDQAISPKLLSTPTSKDFQHILTFLLRQVDPAFQFEKRFEDEVPALLKTLRYPFNVSKSALHAVGSPHTWPALLAVLSWMLDLLNYDDAARAAKENAKELETDDAFGKDLFFTYASRTYDAFLAGDDDFPELEQELEAIFTQRDADSVKRSDALELENDELRKQIEALEQEESPVIALRRKRDDYEADVDKFSQLIQKLDAHKLMLMERRDEKRHDLATKQDELRVTIDDKLELKTRISVQDSQAIDVSRIASDRAALKSRLHKVAEQRDAAERAHAAVETQVTQRVQCVEDMLHEYHGAAERLQLVPSTARNARGMQLRVTLSRDAGVCSPDKLLSLRIAETVLPAVTQLKGSFDQHIARCLDEMLQLREKIDELDELLVLKRDEQDLMKQRHAKLEATYRSERDALNAQLAERKQEAVALDETIRELKAEGERVLHESATALAEQTAEYKSIKQQLQLETQQISDNLFESMDILTNHKAHIQEVLAALCHHASLIDLTSST
ncbi:Kinetochore protein NDC80-like [Porphyridium purpureum]|uniref:Kinetochore protein NDC80 n=1 Tax=Porphyridium purpureum TaxID=35688 RepID=A0A5J4YUM5_PORPP|nr:Kinetochore protein NDC80-like [Porphyridium purpureum]|eukprot:POR3731..scf227_4